MFAIELGYFFEQERLAVVLVETVDRSKEQVGRLPPGSCAITRTLCCGSAVDRLRHVIAGCCRQLAETLKIISPFVAACCFFSTRCSRVRTSARKREQHMCQFQAAEIQRVKSRVQRDRDKLSKAPKTKCLSGDGVREIRPTPLRLAIETNCPALRTKWPCGHGRSRKLHGFGDARSGTIIASNRL